MEWNPKTASACLVMGVMSFSSAFANCDTGKYRQVFSSCLTGRASDTLDLPENDALAPYGGPYVGFLTTKERFVRQMPGRLIGQTIDTEGRRGFVLTLATREQHIRREKATSNICTNQSLCALAATIYLCLHGKTGLKMLAEHNLAKAHYAAAQLQRISRVATPFTGASFNEFVVRVPDDAERLLAEMRREKILGGLPLKGFYPELDNHLLVCCTELVSRAAIDRMVHVYRKFAASIQSGLPALKADPVPASREPR